MSGAQVEQRGSGLDIFKWVVVAALVLAGAVGNAYFAEQSLLYRVLALVAVAAVAGLIALQTHQGRALWTLANEKSFSPNSPRCLDLAVTRNRASHRGVLQGKFQG